MAEVLDPPAAHQACAALTVLDQAVDALLAANLWSMSEAETLAHRKALQRVAAKLDAARLAAIREVEGRGAAVAAGASSTQAWLQGALRMRPAAAKEEVALATALDGDLAVTGHAVASGEVSLAHAAEVARAVAALPAAVPPETRRKGEAFLLEQSRHFRPDQVATMGRHLLHAVDPELGQGLARDEQDEVDATTLTLVRRRNGSRDLRGHLDAESGALLEAAIDPLAAPRPAVGGLPDLRTAGQRRAQALIELVRLAMASPDMPEQGGEPVTMLVTVPMQTLESRLSPGDSPGDECDAGCAGVPAAGLEDGTPLSAEAARRLACDAKIVAAVLGTAGEILDIGRTARAVPRAIRRALVARDGGCAFPGCDRPPAWCHAHHIIHWAHRGPTALTNLVLLCGHHHRVVHHHGWRVHIGPEGLPIFTPPRWIDPDQVPISRSWRRSLDQLPLLN